TGYGRIVRNQDGHVVAIVEERDATDEQKAIQEINTGIYVFRADKLFAALEHVEPDNAQGEYYLTDVIGVLTSQGDRVAAMVAEDADELMGVNDRVQLAGAEAVARRWVCERLMREGVSIVDPATTYIDDEVSIGQDTVVLPGTHLVGRCRIGAECTIGPRAYVEECTLGDGCRVEAGAVLRRSTMGQGCQLGPNCHVREGCQFADGVRIGTSTEVVRTTIGAGSRALHFSYLGDAELGEDVNIGAGCVTCNFDGRQKHRTVIESGAFVGSDAILVAPVRIGRGAFVAAGSVITEDVPAGALAIARERQSTKTDWARRRFQDRGD
ncbi:MAG: bifunctional UDP-N-acetylglucosamine diphosphorylase/glucosamine-1-phosphate N-acetyltransferase GlmU, partial [Armatimonadetes bacterium]|nr:bifunctional UDP-N-acetylglucosamine diphosphorylase/glucosamine-1-phosphate N-acetyltransferase GlmU [Armatimonadota bacterium]